MAAVAREKGLKHTVDAVVAAAAAVVAAAAVAAAALTGRRLPMFFYVFPEKHRKT